MANAGMISAPSQFGRYKRDEKQAMHALFFEQRYLQSA